MTMWFDAPFGGMFGPAASAAPRRVARRPASYYDPYSAEAAAAAGFPPFMSEQQRYQQQQQERRRRLLQQQQEEEEQRQQELYEQQLLRQKQQAALRQQRLLQQQQQQQQQQHRRSHHHHHRRMHPFFDDDEEDHSGSGSSSAEEMVHDVPLEAPAVRSKKQQLLLQQQREQREQREREEQERHRAKRLRALYNRSVVRAAVTIQRRFREHLQRKRAKQQQEQQQRRAKAGQTVLRALRAWPQIRNAKAAANALREMQRIRAHMTALAAPLQQPQYQQQQEQQENERVWSEGEVAAQRKELLGVQDQLERAILSLDSVQTQGDAFLRAARKEAVSLGQTHLHAVDEAMRLVQSRSGAAQARRRDRAARIVTRTIRTCNAVCAARAQLEALRQTRALEQQLQQAKDAFQEKLEAIASSARQMPACAATADAHKRLQQEIVALLDSVSMH